MVEKSDQVSPQGVSYWCEAPDLAVMRQNEGKAE
jgi:hypothetical protein